MQISQHISKSDVIDIQTGLKYIMILDFQATCQQNTQLNPCSQIIQFPVRVIKYPQLQWKQHIFHYYVKPTFNPNLTKFCTSLTGITQEKVNQGKVLTDVLKQFDNWLKERGYNKPNQFIFLTCGDWDLKTCLKKECSIKNIQIPQYFRRYVNIKRVFPIPPVKNLKKWHTPGMSGMLNMLGLQLQGKHHSGIDDTYNIGRIMIEIGKQGNLIKKEHISKVF